MRFRKKPVTISARRTRFTEEIKTVEGTMTAGVGDWIITGVAGETYPCKDDIFRKTYEAADEEARQELMK